MELIIKSKIANRTFVFFKRNNADGYIYDSTYAPGTLGQQICRNGAYMGNTLSTTDDNFEHVCRRWYRAHITRIKNNQ